MEAVTMELLEAALVTESVNTRPPIPTRKVDKESLRLVIPASSSWRPCKLIQRLAGRSMLQGGAATCIVAPCHACAYTVLRRACIYAVLGIHRQLESRDLKVFLGASFLTSM